MLGQSPPALLDEKQLLADIQNDKTTAIDLSQVVVKDEKAQVGNSATLSGHESLVNALTVLPDGRLASGSYDNTIKLWDTKSGTCQATLHGHKDEVLALTVLPDGRLASGSTDKTIKLWECGFKPLSWLKIREIIALLKHHPSIRKVNLQNTVLSDADIPELAAILQTNKVVIELNLLNTHVTAQGVDLFYQSLPVDHPLRDGLRHEAMLSILCKDVLQHFFSYSLIHLMVGYVSDEDLKQSLATTSFKPHNSTTNTSISQTPFSFFNPSSSAGNLASPIFPTAEETQATINANQHLIKEELFYV